MEDEVCDVWELNNTRRVIIKLRKNWWSCIVICLNRCDRCKSADTRQRRAQNYLPFQSRHNNFIHSLSKAITQRRPINSRPINAAAAAQPQHRNRKRGHVIVQHSIATPPIDGCTNRRGGQTRLFIPSHRSDSRYDNVNRHSSVDDESPPLFTSGGTT